jgi:hypothetical protein
VSPFDRYLRSLYLEGMLLGGVIGASLVGTVWAVFRC